MEYKSLIPNPLNPYYTSSVQPNKKYGGKFYVEYA